MLLEDDDATSAESYFNRASLLVHSVGDVETQLHFKLSQARILDSKRRFGEAALRYHELSYSTVLAEDDRLSALKAAVTCAVLAPAGPTRSRILATLYRDERSAGLPDYTVLRKTFLDQIIRPSELVEFESRLRPHQLARLPPTSIILADDEEEGGQDDGSPSSRRVKKGPETVFDRAVMQHNLLSASRIYTTITFRGLGLLVGLTPSAAEAMARTMIQEKRLAGGRIDQVRGVVMFEGKKKGEEGVVSNVAVAGGKEHGGEDDNVIAPATARWDESVSPPRSHFSPSSSKSSRCRSGRRRKRSRPSRSTSPGCSPPPHDLLPIPLSALQFISPPAFLRARGSLLARVPHELRRRERRRPAGFGRPGRRRRVLGLEQLGHRPPADAEQSRCVAVGGIELDVWVGVLVRIRRQRHGLDETPTPFPPSQYSSEGGEGMGTDDMIWTGRVISSAFLTCFPLDSSLTSYTTLTESVCLILNGVTVPGNVVGLSLESSGRRVSFLISRGSPACRRASGGGGPGRPPRVVDGGGTGWGG